MKRAVRTILRLVAAGLLLFGLLSIGLEFARQVTKKAGEPGWWPWVIGAILLVAGVFLFMASASLAEQLTDDVDDNDDRPIDGDEA